MIMTYLMFARWFGIVSVILALGILFNLEDALEMAKKMLKSETGYIMGGVLPVIFGSLSLLFIDSFTLSWNLVITLVGLSILPNHLCSALESTYVAPYRANTLFV